MQLMSDKRFDLGQGVETTYGVSIQQTDWFIEVTKVLDENSEKKFCLDTTISCNVKTIPSVNLNFTRS